jgi:hypothetical protein
MMEAVIKNSDKRAGFSEYRPDDYGPENALARKVRNEYPVKPVERVMAEYGLTRGEAAGVVYGTASKTTMKKVIKASGLGLAIELWCDVLADTLEAHLEREAKEARDAENRSQAIRRAAEARLRLVESRPLGDGEE